MSIVNQSILFIIVYYLTKTLNNDQKLRINNVRYFTEMVDEKFFSVLKTLASAFRGGDPCQDIQRYSGGLKNFCRGDVVLVNLHFFLLMNDTDCKKGRLLKTKIVIKPENKYIFYNPKDPVYKIYPEPKVNLSLYVRQCASIEQQLTWRLAN